MNMTETQTPMEDIKILLQTRNLQKKRKLNAQENHRDTLEPKENGRIRINYQNIKGIQYKEDIYKYMETMKEYNVDIWGWSETNINWTPNIKDAVKYMSTKIFDNYYFTTSNSDDPSGRYQQGGTQTVLVNNLVGRKISSCEDAKGLER